MAINSLHKYPTYNPNSNGTLSHPSIKSKPIPKRFQLPMWFIGLSTLLIIPIHEVSHGIAFILQGGECVELSWFYAVGYPVTWFSLMAPYISLTVLWIVLLRTRAGNLFGFQIALHILENILNGTDFQSHSQIVIFGCIAILIAGISLFRVMHKLEIKTKIK